MNLAKRTELNVSLIIEDNECIGLVRIRKDFQDQKRKDWWGKKKSTQRERHERKRSGKEERYRMKEELMGREDSVGIQEHFTYFKGLLILNLLILV